MAKPIKGRLWRRSRHGGGLYYAGILDDGSRVVVWERGGRRQKGDPAADVEVYPPVAVRPPLDWGTADSVPNTSEGEAQ